MNFYSNGKLLLTAEYLVMDGAKSLALPTKYGQNLTVTTLTEGNSTILWKSLDVNNNCWLECEIDYSLLKLKSLKIGDVSIANKLVSIIKEAKHRNPLFLNENANLSIITKLEFDRSWGLGSSSTLINNIAQWAKVNAFDLQFTCFGGSGYDIACASNDNPIIYSLENQSIPKSRTITFNPLFKDNLFFVHLNKKQNSRDAILTYKKQSFNLDRVIEKVNGLTSKMISCSNLDSFEALIKKHEELLSTILKQPTVKELYFHDYFGEVKSLGAWGGDFILATGNDKSVKYFKSKGFETVLSYHDMIK